MNKEELIKMRDTLNDWIESFEEYEYDEIEEIEEVETPKVSKYEVGDLIILRDDLKDNEIHGRYSYQLSMGYLQNTYSRIDDINFDASAYCVDGWYITDEMIDHDKSLYLNSFTKDERQFLSFLDSEYKWIAKDEGNGEVWVYGDKPNTYNGEYLKYWSAVSPEVYKLAEDVFPFSFDKLGTDQPVRIYKDLNY